MPPRLVALAHSDLALAREVDRLGEHARGFLLRVETHRVFGFHEIEEELRLALEIAGWRELVVRVPALFADQNR